MKKNDLLKSSNTIIRILDLKENKALIIDCIKRTVPKWYDILTLSDYCICTEQELSESTNIFPLPIEKLDAKNRCHAYKRYTMIAGVLPFVDNEKERCYAIAKIAEQRNISKQTVKNTLCLYLAYQNISVLAPKMQCYDKPLTQDEKNMRWALNKYFYNQNRNSLQTAYTLMLKDKYRDANGALLPKYPTIHQFRYFYRKHRKMQNYYISRNGLKNYQRNNRPLTGDGIQEFAPAVGVGMLDATVCDIYLVNESGGIVGRPILTACVDAYSGLCCGYSLSWEGGVYSLRNLMLNVIADKTKLCKKHGINIKSEQWNCAMLPGLLVTDMGKEYVSDTFGQITDLGVTIENLPPYRPELKGAVEKFFDLIQELYKPHLKGKGVIESDYQERGAHDYRKDAQLTMADFEKVIIRCIIYYNSQRIIDNFPYTENMLTVKIKPYASDIWNYSLNQAGANLISVDYGTLILTLLPRTTGKFSRKGLIVNKMRYKNDNFTERYLNGDSVTVAYNPDDVSEVWLIENDAYSLFTLIESRFNGKDITEVEAMKTNQKAIVKASATDNLQAKINLAEYINTIATVTVNQGNANIKGIRENRKREQQKTHIDYVKEGAING
jgi:transposase InsO family protein